MAEGVEAVSLAGLFDRVLSARGWRIERGNGPRQHPLPRVCRLTGAARNENRATLSLYERERVRLLLLDFGEETVAEAAERPEALFNRYLDLNAAERLALWTVPRAVPCEWLVCVTGDGARLLSVEHESVFGSCPLQASEEAVQGCLETLDRENVGVVLDLNGLGRELASWLDLAGARLGRALKWGRNDGDRLARHLVFGLKCVLAQAQRAPGDCAALAPLGVEDRSEGDTLRAAWTPPSASALVERLLDASSAFAPVGTGAFAPLERRAMSRQLEPVSEAALAPCLEVLRLSAAKLRPHVFLRALGMFAEEHAAWRLALLEPLEVESAIGSPDLLVSGPLRLDVESCGAGRVVEAVEKLALYAWEHMSDVALSGGLQLNLLDWQEGLTERDLTEGPFNWVCRRALRVCVARERQDSLALVAAFQLVDLWARPVFHACHNALPVAALPSLFDPSV